MPTYVYECAKCGDEFEQWQSFSDDPLKKHPVCGGKVTKVLQPVGIVFKGSGFHKTDSRNGSKRSRGGSSEKDTTSSESSETKTETKTDAKTDTKTDSKTSDAKKSDTRKSEPKPSDPKRSDPATTAPSR